MSRRQASDVELAQEINYTLPEIRMTIERLLDQGVIGQGEEVDLRRALRLLEQASGRLTLRVTVPHED